MRRALKTVLSLLTYSDKTKTLRSYRSWIEAWNLKMSFYLLHVGSENKRRGQACGEACIRIAKTQAQHDCFVYVVKERVYRMQTLPLTREIAYQ